MYDYQTVYQAALTYFKGDELAANVWVSKYALRNGDTYLELTPADMHRRMAREFARIESKYPQFQHPDKSEYGNKREPLTEERIFELFQNFGKVIPQGSVMAMLGNTQYIGSLSNCTVLPKIYDSYGGILFTDQRLAQLFKRRAGCGIDISTLRPKGMGVTNAAITSTGAVSFMDRFSNTTREVALNGRRGALMVTIDCRHPEIEDFINIKKDKTRVTGANISIMWTDDFMEAIRNGEDYVLRFPVDVSVEKAEYTKTVNALEIWNKAIEGAWDNAEPGCIFIDTMRQQSTCNPYQEIITTNPCVRKGTLVDTPKGSIAVEDITVGTLINTIDGVEPVEYVQVFYDQPLFDVTFDNVAFSVTADHKYAVLDGETDWSFTYTSVRDLKIGDRVLTSYDANINKRGSTKVVAVKELGETDTVYDLYCASDNWVTSGVVQRGCSEIGMGVDSCRLIAINMFDAVDNPYTPDASFNFSRWYETVYESMVLSDNLVELEIEHIKRILDKINKDPEPDYIKAVERRTWEDLLESAEKGRRTGLGFTALGDTIAALGHNYDSPIALEIMDVIMLTKLQAEWDASTDMAIDRGAMQYWNSGYKSTDFTEGILRESAPKAYGRMLKHGRRNISISTIAPTGSLSILAKLVNRHGTTGGVEPLFAGWFKRRKKINPSDTNARVDFVDELGDSWQEFNVYHNGLLEWADANEVDDVEANYHLSPYYQATAPEIDWLRRVEIQATLQKYVTHSISSTVNLPNSATQEDVSQIYQKAWEMGLKGITIYRDGSRSGVLITNDTKDAPTINKQDAPKRPERLPAKIYNTSVKGQYWVVAVGFLNNDPYEVFAYPNGRVSYSEGVIIKRGGGHYALEVDGKVVVEDMPLKYENDEQMALTRMISTSLRHGTPVEFVIEQLKKAEGTIVDFSSAISRALSKLVDVDSSKMKTSVCLECGSDNVKMESGCLTCLDCGSSKCG